MSAKPYLVTDANDNIQQGVTPDSDDMRDIPQGVTPDAPPMFSRSEINRLVFFCGYLACADHALYLEIRDSWEASITHSSPAS